MTTSRAVPVPNSEHVRNAATRDLLCPSFLAAMGVLGKRWNALVIQAIGRGASRFVDIRDAVEGISDAVLARRLGELREWDLVVRAASECPEDADPSQRAGHRRYRLTPRGAALVPALDELTEWAEEWMLPSPISAVESSNASEEQKETA